MAGTTAENNETKFAHLPKVDKLLGEIGKGPDTSPIASKRSCT